MIRFFIALEITEENRAQIRQIQQGLSKLIPQARLTDSDKLHLTLAFIGEQPDELKDQLVEIIKEAVMGITPFSITPAYLDGFPHLHSANILWIGVKGDIDILYKLKHRLKDELKTLNLIVDERRYVPHIAIAKVNNFHLTEGVEKEFEKIISADFQPIAVSSVKLFESIPQHGFHKHNTLAEIRLGNTIDIQ